MLEFTPPPTCMRTFNSGSDSPRDHVIELDLCLRGCVGVAGISGSKSILLTQGLCVSLLVDKRRDS